MNEAAVEKDTIRYWQKIITAEPIIAVQKLNYDETDSTIIETSWVDNKLYFQE